ncbi:hypothetical protein F7731_07000 [Cytobacillus depressus]|uniref:Uncharacterized protein n=1 Tax=Cytobacillus depressus TaxID=1602942 RepID=A0A6L3V7E2_9BACI|nr:hypothetical protein [Cytobacillus depressus]KAB2337352.1 hypothetical protein F7731_07000 [Cytobacillus depressus]
MLRNRLIVFGILALTITVVSPFIFYSYFEEKPADLHQSLVFGGPFPFAVQKATLPQDEEQYPLEVKFMSPFETETNFKVTPFLFSFICFFLLLFAFYSIIIRLFIGRKEKEPN